MINCKTAVQKLLNVKDLDAIVEQLGIFVFNYRDYTLKRISNVEDFKLAIKNSYLWLTALDSQALQRPFPRRIGHGDFRVLEEEELNKGFSFNNLQFESDVVDEKLVVTYKGRKVYEEPVYFMFHDETEDDEDDEEYWTNIEETCDCIGYREDFIKTVLKEVYGKASQLRVLGTYPTYTATHNFRYFITEYLNLESLDAFTTLHLFLQIDTTPDQYDAFIEHVSQEWESVEDIVDILFKEYIDYCGVSVGYRTCVWDSMVSVYEYFNADLEHEAIVAMIERRFDCGAFRSYKEYDIGITTMVESMTYLWKLYQEAEGKPKKALALGLLCSADVWASV